MSISGIEASIGIAIGTIPFAVQLLKAKGWVALICLFLPVIGTGVAGVSAVRLAKPHSWWARHYYGPGKTAAARERYPDAPHEPEQALAAIAWLALIGFGMLALLVASGVVG
jgi:hypothetical protein